MLNLAVIAAGILVSFFLKGFNFLSLNFEKLGGSIIYPDFLLIFVIFFALRRGEFSGLWIGFFAGLLEDAGLLGYAEKTGEFLPIIEQQQRPEASVPTVEEDLKPTESPQAVESGMPIDVVISREHRV